MDSCEELRIGVSLSFKGLHNWPEASECAGQEVKFLETEHRHTFYVTVEMEVSDEDREIEFYVLQNQLRLMIQGLYGTPGQEELAYKLGRRSCETIARDILLALRTKYSNWGNIEITVSEDNEVWARLKSNR